MSLDDDALAQAQSLMLRFAERTGLDSERPPRRYLWTDAFAVCNFLGLWRATGDARHRELALALVAQVHRVLGRHRPDDPRHGWISGLSEAEGERHPTLGGLRIGKLLPERPPEAPLDERLEWDRDGQYFHYLTRWTHALDQASRATGDPRFLRWACELAVVAHRAFTRGSPGRDRRMVWKRSVDLSRALVASMGQHDPLDGWIGCLALRATAAHWSGARAGPELDAALADFGRMAEGGSWATADPLGLGGLLVDAARVAQLMEEGAVSGPGLLDALLASALTGLPVFEEQGALREPVSRRLAFRELGLAIGLSSLGPIECALDLLGAGLSEAARIRARLRALAPHLPLGSRILRDWRDPEAQRTRLWQEHADIDDVMLATALAPQGYLIRGPIRAPAES